MTSEEMNRTAMALDPVLWARVKLEIVLDPTQSMVVRSNAHRLILNCHRQWGKSFSTGLVATHRAVHRSGVDVITVSRTLNQSAEWLRRVAGHVRRLGMKVRGDGYHRQSILLENGSRIIALPGEPESNRGYSKLDLLIFEEAARVPRPMWVAMRPMLAVSNGDLFLISTPWGQEGFFYDEWMFGEGWTKVKVQATECPRIAAEFLAEERRVLGESAFRQEYLCEFLEGDEALLAREVIEGAFTEEIDPLPLGRVRR